MKKILIISITIFLFSSCIEPILRTNEYQVVDTLDVSKTGMGSTLGYDVIVKFNHDSTFHYGYINKDGELTSVKIKPVDLKKYK